MIAFFYETDFLLVDEPTHKQWINQCITTYEKETGDLNFIFMNDEQLLKINQEYLNHDYYTDIISFESNEDERIQGDIFISIERVKENAENLKVEFQEELHRVMIHGVLHFLGFADKTEEEKAEMRAKENELIKKYPS